MRKWETHFEQVPIEIVRTMLQQQTVPDEPAGQAPAVVSQRPKRIFSKPSLIQVKVEVEDHDRSH